MPRLHLVNSAPIKRRFFLRLAGDRAKITLEVFDYENPLAQNPDDASWLTAAQSRQFAGRFERVVDAGHVIGVTREGVATSFYKVITDGANNLVTAFPVKP